MEDKILVKYLKCKYRAELVKILEEPLDETSHYIEIEYVKKLIVVF